MSDSEFNANQAKKIKKGRPAKRRRRPKGLTDWQWDGIKQVNKNRYLVSAKLSDVNWMNLRSFLVQTNRNYNSGLNYLIATHPELQDNA